MDVNGDVNCEDLHEYSDSTLKQNIDQISESRISGIYNLSGKTYQLKEKVIQFDQYNNDSILVAENDTIEDNRFHFGLIAQEVQQYYPEIVFENNEGILSLSYNDLIPIVIEALKDQKNQIEQLENEIENLKTESNLKSTLSSNEDNIDENISAVLYQNKPNPFNEDTEIQYYLPENINRATISIYDLSGSQIKNYLLTKREAGSHIIRAEELSPGMYLYSLIADGDLIDTKRMVLTDY